MSAEYIQDKLNKAINHHKSGNILEAIEAYEVILFPIDTAKSTLSSSALTSLYGNLGALRMQIGDNEKAAECFDLAIQASPENSQALYNIAVLYTSKLNEHRKALTYCIKAMKYDPSSYKVLHLMGNIFQAMGRNDDAEKYYIQAESLATAPATASSSSSTTTSGRDLRAMIPILQLVQGSSMDIDVGDLISTVTCLSNEPLVYHINQLLSSSEISHIIKRAKEVSLEKSYIMGGSSLGLTEDDPSPYRLSYNAWLPYDPILKQIQARIATLTGISQAYIQQHSEDLQVVRYESGGEFKIHQDSSAFHPRLLTVLCYLSSSDDNMTGGETWFPYANSSLSSPDEISEAIAHVYNSMTDIADEKTGLTIKPSEGSAVIFFNYMAPDFNKIDPRAVHAGLPVTYGEKWVANYWISNDPQLLHEEL